MELENNTPFSALAYDFVNAKGEEFHVIVARGTYELIAQPSAGGAVTHVAELAVADPGLVLTDVYYGELNKSSVEVESDLTQLKPKCDVVVVGSAHSPTGEPEARVDVRVRIRRPAAAAAAPGTGGEALLDHHLAVYGERAFERRGGGWHLTDPEPFVALPLRYEHAFGGELKVYAGTEAADRLDDAHRLSDEARRAHPEGEGAPLAHATCMQNPVGTGFLEGWYAEAAEVSRWPAPRIEAPGAGITAEAFERMVVGKARAGEVAELSPRGVGVITKPWQPRLRLAGSLDATWLAERWPLMPDDFDMAYWNGAHPDMQCERLAGAERVELWNTLPRGAPGVAHEAAGTVCRFAVAEETVAGRFVDAGGAVGFAAAVIDTLVVDLAAMRLSIVWRVAVPASLGIREARLLVLPRAGSRDAGWTTEEEHADRS